MLGKLKKKINGINLWDKAKVAATVTSATIFSLFMTSCGDKSEYDKNYDKFDKIETAYENAKRAFEDEKDDVVDAEKELDEEILERELAEKNLKRATIEYNKAKKMFK